MELLNSLVGQINDILWSYVLIILLIGAGIIFTIRTKFVQINRTKQNNLKSFKNEYSLKLFIYRVLHLFL